MKNIAIILAGGNGNRMGNDIPKQFIVVAGKSILAHTLSVFQNNSHIDEIIIVGNPQYLEQINAISENFDKVSAIVPGGRERYHSTLSALKTCSDKECNLIIHDAVRPLVNERIINDNIQALGEHDACTTAFRATDTMLVSDASYEYVKSIPDRSLLYHVQTPQSFKKNILEQAYNIALKDPDFQSTDDCGVVIKYLPEVKIKIVAGDQANLKLTYATELILVEELLKNRMNQ